MKKFWDYFYIKARHKGYDFFIFLFLIAIPFSLAITTDNFYIKIFLGGYTLFMMESNTFYKFSFMRERNY